MSAKAIRKIASDLDTALRDGELERDAIKLAITRLNAQAEMIENGLLDAQLEVAA